MSAQPEPLLCPDCLNRQANLGDPSHARWVGPDGESYCSLHFVQRFGHAETLVRVEDYVPPATAKAPAPKEST
jgi:hypothetical protein